MINKFLLISFLFYVISGFSQDISELDSLNADIERLRSERNSKDLIPSDTIILVKQIYLLDFLLNRDQPKAMDLAQEVLQKSEELDFKKGIGGALQALGTISVNIGDYDSALKYFKRSLDLREEFGIPTDVAASYLNMGQAFEGQGNYAEALNVYLKAKRIYETADSPRNLAGCALNIGILYAKQGKNEEGLAYFEEALEGFQNIGFEPGIAFSYTNIGSVSSAMGLEDKAIKYDSLSLMLNTKQGNRMGIANGYNNLAYDYEIKNDFQEAERFYRLALSLNEEMGDLGAKTMNYFNLGALYAKLKQYDKAEMLYDSSLTLALETGSYHDISDNYQSLASLDSVRGDYAGALANYQKYISARDTIQNQAQTRKFTQVSMQYEFDKKEEAAFQAQARKDELATIEARKQRMIKNGFGGGFVIVVIFASVFFFQRNKIKKGKKLSDDLLLNILPAETAEELKANGYAVAKSFDHATVLFTDFKNFTELSENLSPEELVSEINYCYSAFDRILMKNGVEKIKTIGDSYMCAGGLPTTNKTTAVDVVNVALEIREFMLIEKKKREAVGKSYFEIRIGCNTGRVVAGIVGIKKYAYDIWGDTVNIASRMESSGEPGKVNISESTYKLVQSNFDCSYRGKIEAKGKGMIDMYFVEYA